MDLHERRPFRGRGWSAGGLYVTSEDSATPPPESRGPLPASGLGAEETYKALFDRLPVGIYRTTPGGDVLYVNPALACMLGYDSASSLMAIAVDEVGYADSDDRAMWRRDVEQGGVVHSVETRWRKADGTAIWVRESARTVRAEDGTVLYYEGAVEDIHAAKGVEDRLQQNERVYRTVVESMDDRILLYRPDWSVLFLNAAARAELALAPGSGVEGRSLIELGCLTPAQAEDVRRNSLDLLTPENPHHTYELMSVDADGTPHWRQWRNHAIFTPDGRPLEYLTICRAITEEKLAEAKRMEEERLDAVSQLSAGVAHEFNNAMAGLQGYLQLALLRGEMNDTTREMLEQVGLAADRIASVTRDLLTFSRQRGPALRPALLDEVVDQATALVRHRLDQKGIGLTLRLGGPPPLTLNTSEVAHLLMDLIENAEHALAESRIKRIEVATGVAARAGRSMAFLRVTDTGCGIPQDQIQRVLLPFFSLKGEHAESFSPLSAVRGVGLGLSVCDRIARDHGGCMSVASEPGNGAALTLWLPLPQEAAHPGETAPADSGAVERAALLDEGDRDAEVGPPPDVLTSYRVLVVDDEVPIRRLLRSCLVREGFEVFATDDGREALDSCRGGWVDVILVDLQMPKMSGMKLVCELQALPADRRPTAFLITGHTVAPDLADLPTGAVQGVLHKPFSLRHVIEQVRQAATKRNHARPAS